MGKLLKIALIFIIILESCNNVKLESNQNHNKKALLPRDYVLWIKNPKNNLLKIMEMGDVIFTCLYKPIEYIICLEEKKDKISKLKLNERKNELNGMVYYEFTLKLTSDVGDLLKHKLNSKEDYATRIKYYAFDMQRDFTLEIGTDVIPCSLFHFERVFDIAPYAKFSIGFVYDKKHKGKESTLIYNDRIFKNGLIKYIYSNDEINKIPKLETND